MPLSKQISSALLVVAVGSSVCLAAAMAQPRESGGSAGASEVSRPKSGHENVARLQKAVTVDFKEWKLRDVIQHLTTETGAVLEPVWKSAGEDGLDGDMLVSFSGKGVDALSVLEKVLEKASGEAITSDENATWQLTSYGAVQIGPRKALNKSKRVEIYDVSDLLFEVPVYDDVPTIDLAQVLQNSGGQRGGSQSIFGTGGNAGNRGDGDRARERGEQRRKRAEDLKRLLASLAEKDQWEENGGSGGTMTVYQGNIIVDAPDYMHRAIAGYTWWPAKPAPMKASRYVAMSGSVEAAKVIGLTPFTEGGGTGGGR